MQEPNQSLYKPALESLRTKIRASTTSMTSVPKPLKFLRPHYDTIKDCYEKIKDQETQVCMLILYIFFVKSDTFKKFRQCCTFLWTFYKQHHSINSYLLRFGFSLIYEI